MVRLLRTEAVRWRDLKQAPLAPQRPDKPRTGPVAGREYRGILQIEEIAIFRRAQDAVSGTRIRRKGAKTQRGAKALEVTGNTRRQRGSETILRQCERE
ncbi:MAG: hypothetical protein DWQ34_01195 [Planctomycetota bacterium]|nr:MAG: hypothetical protein DWQ29_07475 [Planctomycetota bacterium]REJ97695.1 MAG: hypothetical protein DWQ34_01195 [Planctomycetota bacterium]REK26690.1 MAG: hypothetical protein DWQ41_09085 [Planctomycetota bacterium]REK35650.1 MAG: hypothetical protein DWQ45_10870 [Planctomycetota bacterium]